ncbi:MAG TPA: hypothetical protein ENG42_01890 [Candidatus Aenigmarchaeota archaeon]|nr:hypothetical protein [Candidatus Aenigmarchaeota archaeon]
MGLKKFIYNSIMISLPKNIIQFLLGIVLFTIIFGHFDTIKAVIGLVAFVATYSCVYIFNDIFDIEEDKKDKEKLEWKIIASGELGIDKAVTILIAMLLLGLSLSTFLSLWFFAMMLLLLFLNLLHSSPFTKFKKSLYKTSINMTLIEFIKYSTGWFALTNNISHFPVWFILTLSSAYTFSYITYKFKLDIKWVKNNKVVAGSIALLTMGSYIISLLVYTFPVSMIILFIAPVIVLLISKLFSWEGRMKNMLFIEYVLLPLLLISLLILTNPVVKSMNEKLVESIDSYKELASNAMPSIIVKPLENITSTIKAYESLDDIEEKINTTFSKLPELFS